MGQDTTIEADNTDRIWVHRCQAPVTVLGPGKRAVIWVQGCSLGCKGCIIPESWRRFDGESVGTEHLAKWVFRQQGIEGVTFSGGEPMQQPAALAQLAGVLQGRGLGIVCYSGYTLEDLLRSGSDHQRELLTRIDLLIDGPYIDALHAPLLWRGSSNQRLIPLSNRYVGYLPSNGHRDVTAGLELFFDADGGFSFAGVPPERGFRHEFRARLLRHGVTVKAEKDIKAGI